MDYPYTGFNRNLIDRDPLDPLIWLRRSEGNFGISRDYLNQRLHPPILFRVQVVWSTSNQRKEIDKTNYVEL